MYTPISTPVYLRALTGCLAGLTAPGVSDTAAGDYTYASQVADAFAQQIDQTVGGDPFDVALILLETICQSVWLGRSPPAAPGGLIPSTYTQLAQAVVARTDEAIAQIAAEGVDPDDIGGPGGGTPAPTNLPGVSLVFQPGGSAGTNVFPTFTALAIVAATVTGPLEIVMDSTHAGVDLVTVPSATYTFPHVTYLTLSGRGGSVPTECNFAAGCVFATPIDKIVNLLAISLSNAAIFNQTSGHIHNVCILEDSAIEVGSAAGFFSVSGTGFQKIEAYGTSQVGDGVHAVIHALDGTGTANVTVFDSAIAEPSCMTGPVAGNLTLTVASPAAQNAGSTGVAGVTTTITAAALGVSYVDGIPETGFPNVQGALDVLKASTSIYLTTGNAELELIASPPFTPGTGKILMAMEVAPTDSSLGGFMLNASIAITAGGADTCEVIVYLIRNLTAITGGTPLAGVVSQPTSTTPAFTDGSSQVLLSNFKNTETPGNDCVLSFPGITFVTNPGETFGIVFLAVSANARSWDVDGRVAIQGTFNPV